MLAPMSPSVVRVSHPGRGRRSTRRGPLPLLAGVLVALLIGGCGGSGSTAGTHGNVNVLYAGSLENLMDKTLGPAFQRATGYRFSGYPAGSTELGNEIRGGVRQGDVFISASPNVNSTLEGQSDGGWVSWYAPFASTRLVLGYNPSGRFAPELRSRPWYRVITEPGFRLGFTDPKLDPKGVLTVAALNAAANRYHDPALKRIATQEGDLFPEEDLVGRLQSGQLDAGFFYSVEASAAGIPTVNLGGVDERSVYTITVLNRAHDAAGAEAFVKFLLGAKGRALMKQVGLSVVSAPSAVGQGVPASLTGVIRPG